MSNPELNHLLGQEVFDATEETFLLFSQSIHSHNLGFVDGKNSNIEVDIGGRDFVIRQSPGLLTSNRSTGTTGAVLWKVTPLVASWLVSMPQLLSSCNALHSKATVVELGCGITGIIGLALAPKISSYVLTDQSYIMKTLRENIANNEISFSEKSISKAKLLNKQSNIKTMALDWEQDSVENLRQEIDPATPIDMVIACDCVYNDHLIQPLVQALVDVAKLGSNDDKSTLIMVAQQLRSEMVFEAFLEALLLEFHVWRVTDENLSPELKNGSGYVVHLAVRRNTDVAA